MSYVRESDIRVKSYDHLNFSRASVVQFWASRYIMRLNRTSVWKVMTIWLSRELPLFNFELLDILCPRIGHPWKNLWPFEFLESFCCAFSSVSIYYVPQFRHPCEKLWPFEFSRASVVQFQASRWVMSANRTSLWKVMTIRISRVLPLCNFERLAELCHRIRHPCEKLCPFEFDVCFRCPISSV